MYKHTFKINTNGQNVSENCSIYLSGGKCILRDHIKTIRVGIITKKTVMGKHVKEKKHLYCVVRKVCSGINYGKKYMQVSKNLNIHVE